MDTISFNKKEYPVRDIDFQNYGSVLISTEELNMSLMNSDGSYSCEDARIIDENIFYFVEIESLNLTDTELTNKIFSEI